MGRLDGKVAIITGAAHGMGLAATKLFLKEGCKVLALDINADTVRENLEVIDSPDLASVVFDVRDAAGWPEVVEQAVSKFGKVNVLVNNAGIASNPTSIVDMTMETWEEIVETDLFGVFYGMKFTIPAMIEAGGGSIVNVASTAAIRGGMADGGSCAYAAAKGGVTAITKSIANAYGASNIRVNAVIPGPTNAALEGGALGGISDAWTPEMLEAYMKALVAAMPLAPHMATMMVEPIDLAYAYLYLASDESRFVTGTEIVVDGGMISH
ncbi:SDR family NAD(P)-dependent oxidoreductase [Adlercreutzia sp. ZJ242]|uniref:SDR family NAD(P)-dependent oxidoreductase n=1 Tax=Adlercreutzia sp. ZJ242 TaxID=2709409 RepID=UPI0013EE0432|nr:SDR family oxidoreductase [Adlercreutzia sp. ZJ242]